MEDCLRVHRGTRGCQEDFRVSPTPLTLLELELIGGAVEGVGSSSTRLGLAAPHYPESFGVLGGGPRRGNPHPVRWHPVSPPQLA